MIDGSWIIQDRTTGKAVLETFNFEALQFVRLDRYRVWPVMAWLQHINREGAA